MCLDVPVANCNTVLARAEDSRLFIQKNACILGGKKKREDANSFQPGQSKAQPGAGVIQ
jgi:hypothetical protein